MVNYVVPDVVTEKEFFEFIQGEFKNAVIEFNSACGKNPDNIEDVSIAVDMVLSECERVIEEADECIKAYRSNNRKERIDGIVDVHWCNTQLEHLINTFNSKFGVEFNLELQSRAYDDVLKVVHADQLSKLGVRLATGTIISGKAVIVAALKVMENNAKKYTDCSEKANDWFQNSEGGVGLSINEYKGKKYYHLKRLSDSKIMKPYNFEEVDLKGI